jgi:hypothetical protein
VTVELTVIAKDRIGLLADVSEALANAKVNIENIALETSNQTAVTRLLVSDERKARHALETAGFKVVPSDVLVVRLKDRPGELAKITRALADKKINIESTYILSKHGDQTLVAVRCEDVPKAKTALKAYL